MLTWLLLSLTPPPAPPIAAPVDSVWYRAVLKRDVTGDRSPETLIVEASGRRVDSLLVTFEIRSHGRRLYHEEWLTTWYFQYDAPIDSMPEPVKYNRVFQHLRELLQPQNFAPLDTVHGEEPWRPIPGDNDDPRSSIAFHLKYTRVLDSLRLQHIDSATAESRAREYAWSAPVDTAKIVDAWQALLRARPLTFTFYSGGEYIRTIVWSARLSTFVVTFSCC